MIEGRIIMPPGYSRPVLMINAGVNAYSAGSNPTAPVIKGTQHLSEITGDIEWPTGVTTGRVVVDIIPRADYLSTQDGEIIADVDIAEMIARSPSMPPPISVHYAYVGNAAYIRHRIMTTVAGGGAPSVTTWHNGYTNY